MAREEYWFEEGCWILELSNSADDVILAGRGRVLAIRTPRFEPQHYEEA